MTADRRGCVPLALALATFAAAWAALWVAPTDQHLDAMARCMADSSAEDERKA